MTPQPYTTARREPTLTDAPNARVVHESDSQRQHVRVRLPGIVEFGTGRDKNPFKLYDLSASGFSFESAGRSFRPGETFRGSLALNLDGVALTLFVNFQVRDHDARSGRTGCSFQELGPQEISALRHLITSHLSGELVAIGDVLHTLSRDNFTRPRANGEARNAGPSRGRNLRALLGTTAFLTAAAVATIYTLGQINDRILASTAAAAKVAGPVYTVVMPREGTFFSLVPDDGIVKKGAPIASFEAPVLDLLRSPAVGASLSPEQLQRLIKTTVKGTITSPCDCRVQNQYVATGQYVAREQPLFELMPRDFKPYLVARFRNDQIGDLAQGGSVRFRVSGEPRERRGTISQVRAPGQGDRVETDVIVVVEPAEPLPAEMLSRPVALVAGGFNPLNLLPTASAGHNDNETP